MLKQVLVCDHCGEEFKEYPDKSKDTVSGIELSFHQREKDGSHVDIGDASVIDVHLCHICTEKFCEWISSGKVTNVTREKLLNRQPPF